MAKIGDGTPGFYLDIATPKVDIRNELGHYTSAVGLLHAQNRQMAYAVQTQVARVISTNIIRQKVSTGRLVRATLDPRNATYSLGNEESGPGVERGVIGFVGVGNEDFLDRSIAKYWRTIEEGSAKTWTKRSFLSLELQGLWGLNIAGWRSGPSGDWVALGGKHESGGKAGSPGGRRGPFGSARQEMYHPFRYGKGANLPVFHPKRQIQPMNAYGTVKRQPQWDAQAVRAGNDFIKRVMDHGIRPAGFRLGN